VVDRPLVEAGEEIPALQRRERGQFVVLQLDGLLPGKARHQRGEEEGDGADQGDRPQQPAALLGPLGFTHDGRPQNW
jgi:hypothetical protein